MTNYCLGIDPGASGALALVEKSQKEIIKVWDMPYDRKVLTTKKKTKRVNIPKLIEIFTEVLQFTEQPIHVNIERVQAFGKQSAPAAFNFGKAAGIIEALAYAFLEPPNLISPVTWKREYGLQASEKDAARLLVKHLFPYTKELLKYKYNVDRADAILIAFYGD